MIQQSSSQPLYHQEQQYLNLIEEFDNERALKNMDKAAKIIKAAQKLFPNYFMVYYKMALYHKQMGDNLKALRNIRLALHLCTSSDERESSENKYWENILCGFECASNGMQEQSEVYFKKAIDIQPYRMEAYFRYALALGAQRRYQDAVPLFETAKACVEAEAESTEPLPLSSESANVLYKLALCVENIGWSYAHQDKHLEAIHHYNEAIRIYPRFVLFYENRFYTSKSMNRFTEAIADCHSALTLTSDVNLQARLHCMMATVHAQANRPECAVEACKKALESDPTLYNSYFELAVLAPYSNDNNMCLEMINTGLSKVIDSNSKYWLLYRRSIVYDHLGRLRECDADKRSMKAIARLAAERID